MTYYQLLQQRRQSLQLSIQDVADQTQLDPKYLFAIENNDLTVFQNDFDFLRSFIQSYCDAIGVNYGAVSQDVEANIQSYRMRNTSAPMPQRQSRGQAVAAKRRKKQSSSPLMNLVNNMMRSKNARVYQLVALAISMVLVLSIINLVLSFSASRQAAIAEEERQAEIAKKEEETKKLAEQKKEAEKKKEIQVSATDKDNNIYEISNVLENSGKLNFTITMPEESTVVFYVNDELIDAEVESIQEDTYKKTIVVDEECTVQLEIGTYADNKITVNDKTVKFSKEYWNEGSPAVMYFDIVGSSSQDEDTSEDTEDEEVVEEE